MFKLTDTNRYWLDPHKKFLHLATISHSLRTYMCFIDNRTRQVYIEEVLGGTGLQFIEDDSLAEALSNFLTEQNIINIAKPALPDGEWLYKGKKDKNNTIFIPPKSR